MMSRSRRQSIPSLASPRTLTARYTSSCWPGGKLREINPGVVDVFLDLRIGFLAPLRRDDKVALPYELSIEEDFDVQIRRCGHDIAAQRIDPANGLPDAPLRPLVNAVPLEDERVLVTEIQFVTRLREQIGIDAAVEFVEFLPRQPAQPDRAVQGEPSRGEARRSFSGRRSSSSGSDQSGRAISASW